MKSISIPENFATLKGEVEIEIRDRQGRVLERRSEDNLIKIFAKEILAHRLFHSRVWDPDAATGSGEWVPHGIDPNEEFAAKYILLGASFDDEGLPLDDSDPRFYVTDPITGLAVARYPQVGADNNGDLINPIPISEPDRSLKKVESVYFEPTYQPPDSPLLQSDVRAMNNVVVLETTLRQQEYNGFGATASDFFTITEVALAAGRPIGAELGACELVPQILFLEGVGGASDEQIIATASGSMTVSIDPSVASSDVNRIREGDQVRLVARSSATEEAYDSMGQVSPFYLVISKSAGGRDVVLDRAPVDGSGNPIAGPIGIYRSTLRIFSHRILSIPFRKSNDFEIVIRWRINFN